MMKQSLFKPLLLCSLSALLFTACDRNDDEESNEEELISSVRMTFTPPTGAPLVYEFNDADGPGGNNPTVQTIALQPNTTYGVSIQLLNTTVNPAEDITTEVAAEAESHRLYYAPAAGSNITVTNLNNDANGRPLGVTSTWTTGAAANGTVRVTLRHYPGNPPNKEASDPVDSPKSSTDVEVDFPTRIQ